MIVTIFHEYGAPEHFQALEFAASKRDSSVSYYEFSILKPIVKAFLKKDSKAAKRSFVNFINLFALPFQKKKVIVLGMAPWDWHIIVFTVLAQKHDIVLFTSWPYWHGDNQPKRHTWSLFRKLWIWFLQNRVMCVASVTETGRNEISLLTDKPVYTVYHSVNGESTVDKSNKERKELLFVGQLIPEKGVLNAIDLAIKTGQELTIVGAGQLSSQVELLEKTNSNITFLGYIQSKEELNNLFSMHRILLVPSKKTSSWEEVFGLVIIEAMRNGCIPICTDHIGPKDILGKEFPELLYPEDLSLNELASVIEKTLIISEALQIRVINESLEYLPEKISKRWSFIWSLTAGDKP